MGRETGTDVSPLNETSQSDEIVVRTYPELMRQLAAEIRSVKDHDLGELELAQVLEIAADRWEDRHYRGDRLLAAIGKFARAMGDVVFDQLPAVDATD